MSARPTLRVSTPLTANFPHIPPSSSELRSAVSLPSAVSTTTPLSAISRTSAFRDPIPSSGLPSAGLPSAGPFSATIKLEHDLQKTPITPPVAYLDFLKGMSLVSPCLASPPQTGKSVLNRASTASSTSSTSSTRSNGSKTSSASAETEDSEKEKGDPVESAPSTARTDVSCESDEKDKEDKEDKEEKSKSPRPAPIDTKRPNTPRHNSSNCPLSAPPAGPAVFPSMKLPASPAISTSGLIYSPRSPLSAASVRSPFDWEAALRSRRFAETPGGSKRPAAPDTPGIPPAAVAGTPKTPGGGHTKRESSSRTSIRHIREVVTRTVTYTPRMGPAPKGKRRKIDPETAVKS
ncbi:hypothetical protein N657DRAFT_564444 [Parathielavia appendiculata]|uniref:Uncharacterized protein n=1 Tax=Parathielavia appendiculata TaxID=2587402 RepID=A0AAN6U5Y2_9PEZI|nr:hypothetical protein N657DRAFT_564444 [Parathielavia appendiculata]